MLGKAVVGFGVAAAGAGYAATLYWEELKRREAEAADRQQQEAIAAAVEEFHRAAAEGKEVMKPAATRFSSELHKAK